MCVWRGALQVMGDSGYRLCGQLPITRWRNVDHLDNHMRELPGQVVRSATYRMQLSVRVTQSLLHRYMTRMTLPIINVKANTATLFFASPPWVSVRPV